MRTWKDKRKKKNTKEEKTEINVDTKTEKPIQLWILQKPFKVTESKRTFYIKTRAGFNGILNLLSKAKKSQVRRGHKPTHI